MLTGQDVITGKKDSRKVREAWLCPEAWAEILDFKRLFLVCVCTFFSLLSLQAQYVPLNMPLNYGEEVRFDIYFKWGILMPRAGEAKVSYNQSSFNGQTASLYRLIFQTVNLFESIYKMRDTLDCYYNPNNVLFFSTTHTVEGGWDATDKLTFTYADPSTSVHSLRYTPTSKRIDTTLTVPSGHVFDMLGATFFVRTIDRHKLNAGDVFPCTVVTGRDLIPTSFRYQGQAIVERDNVKYRTHYYIIDIHDEVFSRTKASAEVWIGDDDNYIPIKIRTKLKIGYAEVHFRNASNLKKPLDCRVEIKK